jgi:hypothetical protein
MPSFAKPQPIYFMHSAFFRRIIIMMVVAMALTTDAKTNSYPQYTRWLIVPAPQLRTGYTEPSASRSDPEKGQVSLSSLPAQMRSADLKIQRSDPIALNMDRGDQDFQSYYFKQRDFGFIRPIQDSDGILGRAFDSVFRPEEFRVGRTTTVSCSILTAIKRKNPFCLLNPIFLNVSW